VNRRGELERAIRRARLPKSVGDVLRLALLYRADNDTGEIPAKYAVSLAQVCADAKVSEWTVRRALGHASRHGWWIRYDDVPGKLAGLVMPGRDCDCPGKGGAAVSACEWCGAPLAGKRRHARFCGNAHRMAATRAETRTTDEPERAETRTPTSRNANMCVQETRTVRATERAQSQVSPVIPQEATTRKIGEEELRGEEPAEPEEPDPRDALPRDPWALWRGTPDFGPQPDDAYWRSRR
jgi:hypothetical protein